MVSVAVYTIIFRSDNSFAAATNKGIFIFYVWVTVSISFVARTVSKPWVVFVDLRKATINGISTILSLGTASAF